VDLLERIVEKVMCEDGIERSKVLLAPWERAGKGRPVAW